MGNITIKDKIIHMIESEPKGTIFSINDFYSIASKDTVKSALRRLESEESIARLLDGLYVAPKYSQVIQEFSYPTVDEVAEKLADKYSWTICPSGIHALNILGLSTQVPNVYIFISDGPYRTYEYRNRTISFKNTSNQYIKDYSRNFSLVVQALKELGEGNISDKHINILAKFCKKHVEEDVEEDSFKFPVWMQKEFLRIALVMEDL